MKIRRFLLGSSLLPVATAVVDAKTAQMQPKQNCHRIYMTPSANIGNHSLPISSWAVFKHSLSKKKFSMVTNVPASISRYFTALTTKWMRIQMRSWNALLISAMSCMGAVRRSLILANKQSFVNYTTRYTITRVCATGKPKMKGKGGCHGNTIKPLLICQLEK